MNAQSVACQGPLFMGFPRQEYWSGLPFLSPGDLPDPGIEPRSPALQAVSLLSETPERREIRHNMFPKKVEQGGRKSKDGEICLSWKTGYWTRGVEKMNRFRQRFSCLCTRKVEKLPCDSFHCLWYKSQGPWLKPKEQHEMGQVRKEDKRALRVENIWNSQYAK